MLWVILFSSEPVLLEECDMGPILEVSIGWRDALRDIRE
jgi:hypothetical protein